MTLFILRVKKTLIHIMSKKWGFEILKRILHIGRSTLKNLVGNKFRVFRY